MVMVFIKVPFPQMIYEKATALWNGQEKTQYFVAVCTKVTGKEIR